MSFAAFETPPPVNEPVLGYAPGSRERSLLEARLRSMREESPEIPMVIGGKAVTTGDLREVRAPHEHSRVLGRWHAGGAEHVARAADAARAARGSWGELGFEERAAVFLRAADLLAGSRRADFNAATMLGQSKSCHQSEIDAACELIDFFRFNVAFARELYGEQPLSAPGQWNRLEYRPLDGFVLAISPFNFTSIAANMVAAPALMGNTVIWKPSDKAMLSAHAILALLEAAGLPPGVINMVAGDPGPVVGAALDHPDLAGITFTGSSAVMKQLWRRAGESIDRYRCFPRFVGECGGKDFVMVHESADPDEVATALVRGAFEYQGQKCSAASRAYLPTSLWPAVKERMAAQLASIKVGPVEDFSNFVNAVIAKDALERCRGYIERARDSTSAKVALGGTVDDRTGWFVHPTVIEASDPRWESMEQEIFGPVLTVHAYDPARWRETLQLCDKTSPYALTGAVFARDRTVIAEASKALRFAAGNFYVNDKPTGAVVGQQPFGGARLSGTNDKAGSKLNLIRWVSPRTIKETFEPPRDYRYPFLG